MDFLLDFFEYDYLHKIVAACLLSSVACGIIGTYIVSRRLVFMSGGITHASFGGIGIAHYMGYNPIVGAFIFALLSAVGIEAVSNRMNIKEDSAIGVMWSAGMAVGVIFLAITPGYAPNMMNFLFGNILMVNIFDLAAMAVLDIVIILIMSLLFRPIMYIAFDREYAATQGMPVNFISYMMMILIAATVVISIRLVGIVLLISLLSIPPVIVGSLTKSFKKIMLYSIGVSALGMLGGLYISDLTDIPPGASAIMTLTMALIITKTAVYFAKKD